ncbi:hypothetical protein GGX14DRAFT_392891 [Mycena pura]|uniref:Uncharacterized protein n=1 Tax=Mycena pura TaxID=153505 RepID=A0AAD6VHX9_9AGAR|nr:hypothetical protein GGX14DRAFT_392891 [Mycena pura]
MWNLSDLGVVARHAASFPDWDDLPSKDRWGNFSQRYPQRTIKSWNEYYRRNSKISLAFVLAAVIVNFAGAAVLKEGAPVPDSTPVVTVCTGSIIPPEGCTNIPVVADTCPEVAQDDHPYHKRTVDAAGLRLEVDHLNIKSTMLI